MDIIVETYFYPIKVKNGGWKIRCRKEVKHRLEIVSIETIEFATVEDAQEYSNRLNKLENTHETVSV